MSPPAKKGAADRALHAIPANVLGKVIVGEPEGFGRQEAGAWVGVSVLAGNQRVGAEAFPEAELDPAGLRLEYRNGMNYFGLLKALDATSSEKGSATRW